MDIESMEEITQDSLQRLIYRVDSLLEMLDEFAQCRSQARLTDRRLTPTAREGVYTVAAGEAVLEIQCAEI